jgi:alkylation response protein AidB-like acyl-CoA dehydrogenase
MSDNLIDLDEYRQVARRWLEANMERRIGHDGSGRVRGSESLRTPEGIAKQRELQRRVFEGGYAGITWPKDYGGQALTQAHERIFEQESNDYMMPTFGVASGTTMKVCGPTILAHGSEPFKRLHIPRILSGDEVWVQFFSEPSAGSDLAAIRTKAIREGDHWIVNGAKTWSSGALYADYGLCLTRTDWTVPKHRGLTWFAVPSTAFGVTIRPIREINGSEEFCEEFLDDVELTDDDILGEVNLGWQVARTILLFERLGGDPSVQHKGGPREFAPDLVSLAKRLGREKDPVVRQLIATAHVNDFVRETVEEWVASLEDDKVNTGIAAYAKLASGLFNPIRARIGIAIGGATAVAWDRVDESGSSIAQAYLDGRILSIAGGTNEMQRNGIAERVLGLPRESATDVDIPFDEVIKRAGKWASRD